MTARDTMKQLFRESKELEAREHTPEEENTLRGRAPEIIEAACREQFKDNGSVFPPGYCLVCKGCPIGTIVTSLSKS